MPCKSCDKNHRVLGKHVVMGTALQKDTNNNYFLKQELNKNGSSFIGVKCLRFNAKLQFCITLQFNAKLQSVWHFTSLKKPRVYLELGAERDASYEFL